MMRLKRALNSRILPIFLLADNILPFTLLIKLSNQTNRKAIITNLLIIPTGHNHRQDFCSCGQDALTRMGLRSC